MSSSTAIRILPYVGSSAAAARSAWDGWAGERFLRRITIIDRAPAHSWNTMSMTAGTLQWFLRRL